MQSGKFPTLRRVQRTHGINVSWISDMIGKGEFRIADCHTDRMAADLFTKWFVNKDKWNKALLMLGYMKSDELIHFHCNSFTDLIPVAPALLAQELPSPDRSCSHLCLSSCTHPTHCTWKHGAKELPSPGQNPKHSSRCTSILPVQDVSSSINNHYRVSINSSQCSSVISFPDSPCVPLITFSVAVRHQRFCYESPHRHDRCQASLLTRALAVVPSIAGPVPWNMLTGGGEGVAVTQPADPWDNIEPSAEL